MVTNTSVDTFKAYVFENFGDAFTEIKLRTNIQHSELADHRVRIRVHAAALNPIDYKLVEQGQFFMPEPSAEKPFRMGFDVAGTLVQVGADVKGLKVGDAVFGVAFFGQTGSFAEYVDVDATLVAPKPAKLTFVQAAGVPSVSQTSYQALVDDGKFKAGDSVLVLGGTSATGTAAIQIAKALGAGFVAATTSTRNVEHVKSFGADQVIDYTTEKWSEVLAAHSIDLIYDCGVEPNSWNTVAQHVLKKETGKFVTIGKVGEPIESATGASLVQSVVAPTPDMLLQLMKLIDAGKLVTPIDSVHPFENLLDAVKVQKSGHARGKIILQVLLDVE
ncbi:Quinone oxidoreductase protein, partial [Globisporangium splendens]